MLAVIADAWPPLIVVVSPASAVDELVPICKVVTEPPNEIAEPSIVIEEFANLPFAIDPANWAVDIPPELILTEPELTVKSPELKDAIPLFVAVASSPDITPDDISIPSPAENLPLTSAVDNCVFVSVDAIVKYYHLRLVLIIDHPMKYH